MAMSEETAAKYGFGLDDMNHIIDVARTCMVNWRIGTWNKGQIADHIEEECRGNIRMAILMAMSSGAMMESEDNNEAAKMRKMLRDIGALG